jgi:hypothetical protein
LETTIDQFTTATPLGIFPNETSDLTISSTDLFDAHTYYNPPASITLTKTAEGEFILTGPRALELLFEYFAEAPEFWLRLLALKAEKENEE